MTSQLQVPVKKRQQDHIFQSPLVSSRLQTHRRHIERAARKNPTFRLLRLQANQVSNESKYHKSSIEQYYSMTLLINVCYAFFYWTHHIPPSSSSVELPRGSPIKTSFFKFNFMTLSCTICVFRNNITSSEF